jgi:hypothetical protein
MTDYGTNANVRGHENESYAAVLDIPIMASPLYQMPQPVRKTESHTDNSGDNSSI